LLRLGALRSGYQEAEGQLAFGHLDGAAAPERPPAAGDVLYLRLADERSGAG
jgi:hypothetical protein